MKNAIKTALIAALLCLPQVGYGISKLKLADRFLGVMGFLAASTIQDPSKKIHTSSDPLSVSPQRDELLQTASDVKNACAEVGLKSSSLSLLVSKDLKSRISFTDPEDSQVIEFNMHKSYPMVRVLQESDGHAKETVVAFNQRYFNLPDSHKQAALIPELLRIKNHEKEKQVVVGTLVPLAITTGAFRAVGAGLTNLLSRSPRLVGNKYGALGLQGIKAVSRSFFLPFVSTILGGDRTQYLHENGENVAIIKSVDGPAVSLWRGYTFKLPAAYSRYRTYEMDKQAAKLVGQDTMIAYLSEPKNESKFRYADPAYSPLPTLKDRLERIQVKTQG